ncbi:hypothetical protein SD457_06275 [Coprobacillaceae bacterium CR2/5/TPMF4]|nr:hypothetical protein SD457_06275 [Coprobacillaceae bacterium CR2/5/TPMF4]
MINESKRKVEEAEDKPQSNQSHLLNLISFAVNSEGFKHDEITVFNMRYYPFLDSIKDYRKYFMSKHYTKVAIVVLVLIYQKLVNRI